MSIKRGNAKWKFEYVIECKARRDFAWQFWTNVNNWPVVDFSLEAVKLHGPFAAGTRGTTKPCGHDPVEWQLTEVQNGSGAVVEIRVPGAVLICVWSFEDAVSGGTRIKQQARRPGSRVIELRTTYRGSGGTWSSEYLRECEVSPRRSTARLLNAA